MRKGERFPPQRGIALGPILFIIAILAILAGAIAAGNSGFSGSTSKESAKSLAQTIIMNMKAVDDCVNVVRSNGYDDTQLDFEVPVGMFTDNAGNDWGSPESPPPGCTSDACGVFKADGGGCNPLTVLPIPQAAIDQTNPSWGMVTLGPNCTGNDVGCRMNALWVMEYPYLAAPAESARLVYGWQPPLLKEVCMEINLLVGVNNPNGDAPHATYGNGSLCGPYCGIEPFSNTFSTFQPFITSNNFCYFDTNYGYQYIHVLN